MADASFPAAPRTVTVRVRTLVIVTVALALATAVWWIDVWLTQMTPLSGSPTLSAPYGLGVLNEGTITGPPEFAWRRGGVWVQVLLLHNSASIPITVTGADGTPSYWRGAFTGPTLELASDQGAPYRAFTPLRIPADGSRVLAVVYHANPAVCPGGTGHDVSSIDSVTLRFSVLGVAHDTQTLPLGEGGFYLRGPSRADC